MDSKHSTFNILTKKVRTRLLNNSFLHSLNWQKEYAESVIDYNLFHIQHVLLQMDPKYNTVKHFDPMWLGAKANNKDTPTWNEATNGPHFEGFWKAMDTELTTLERIDAWIIVDRKPDMNVLDSVWTYKIKCFPDGSLQKLKARFCVKGFQQIKGVDFFETYSSVVFGSRFA